MIRGQPSRVLLLLLAVIVLMSSGLVAGEAQRNHRFILLGRELAAHDGLTEEQARVAASLLGGQSAVIWLLGTAERQSRPGLHQQMALLDLIHDQGLTRYLSAAEVQEVVKLRASENGILMSQQMFSEVLIQSEKILSLKPDSVDGLTWRAQALGRLGRHPEAVETFENALRLYPESVEALTAAAYYYFYYSPGRAWEDRAEPLLARALLLDSGDALALRLMTEYLLDKRQCEQAAPLARRDVQLYPGDPDTWVRLAHVDQCLGGIGE